MARIDLSVLPCRARAELKFDKFPSEEKLEALYAQRITWLLLRDRCTSSSTSAWFASSPNSNNPTAASTPSPTATSNVTSPTSNSTLSPAALTRSHSGSSSPMTLRALAAVPSMKQIFYQCFTCQQMRDQSVCESCAAMCHAGHDLSAPRSLFSSCGCSDCRCLLETLPPLPKTNNILHGISTSTILSTPCRRQKCYLLPATFCPVARQAKMLPATFRPGPQ